MDSPGDISIVVDIDWLSHYEGRDQHSVTEVELVAVEGSRVLRIGKEVVPPDGAYGEFIGLAKFSKTGAEISRSNYQRVVAEYRGRAFQQAASVGKAYLTHMIQELVNLVTKFTASISKGVEINTPEDLERAGTLSL